MPRAPLPGLGVTRTRATFNVASVGVAPPSSLIWAHAPVLQPLPSFVLLMKEVFAGCCRPLLVTGPSRHYLCNPCVGAWTHTPPCSSGAYTHFFPEDSGLTSRETRSAHENTPAMQLQQGAYFRGCSHSFIFRLPHSLGLQVAPTVAFTMPSGQAVYTTHRPGGYPSRDVVSLRVRHGQLTRLDFHQLDCSLVGCSFPHWAFTKAAYPVSAIETVLAR